MNDQSQGESAYKKAGVDIDGAKNLLENVKDKLAATSNENVLSRSGGFGGLFHLDKARFDDPVLVSSIDGVGTKVMVAEQAGRYEGLGHDIVNHCIDDILVQGATPLFFMDYLGAGKLSSPMYEDVLSGIADACKAEETAVLGGETAEMPGMYGEYFDLVGAILGVVERQGVITGENISPGDALLGLKSSGLHTNGYSLARQVLFETCGFGVDTYVEALGETVADALLRPHVSYRQPVCSLMQQGIQINGLAHITGGGWWDNLPRVLPEGVDLKCEKNALPVPPIISVIGERGGVSEAEMYRVFNMGMGYGVFLPEAQADKALEICEAAGFTAAITGEVVAGDGRMYFKEDV